MSTLAPSPEVALVPQDRPPAGGRWVPLRIGLFYYLTTCLLVWLGVLLGRNFFQPSPRLKDKQDEEWVQCLARWDGYWYKQIVQDGYSYNPERRSNVAFFPLYPLLGRLVAWGFGWSATWSLLFVAHAALLGAFIFLAAYARQRFPGAAPEFAPYVVLTFGLWPTTFFFRMTYTEALFTLLAVAALYGMARRWPLLLIAGTIGLATATRSVGVALLVPFALYLWRGAADRRRLLGRAAAYLPLACGGLLLYMAYQYVAFGPPLGFAQTQTYWQAGDLEEGRLAKWLSLITLQPLFEILYGPPWFTLHPVNPEELTVFSSAIADRVFFILAAVLIGVGAWRDWLNVYETTFGLAVLLIPYVTRSYEMRMASAGRFAAVAFPAYLVAGLLLGHLSAPRAALVLVGSGVLFVIYTAMFVNEYRFF